MPGSNTIGSAEWGQFVDAITTHLTRFRRCGVFGTVVIKFQGGRPVLIEATESMKITRRE